MTSRRHAPRERGHHDGAHALRQVVGQPCRPRRAGRHGAALHRPPPRARGDEPAGVRRAEARRPQDVARGSRSSRPPTTTRRPRTGTAASAIPISRTQVETLDANIREHGAKAYFPFLDRRQGIVHVIGPEQGATLPGMTVVCGDSHTSTHGAFAALAFGIGTSEVEHVLATQCLRDEEGEVDADPRRRPPCARRDREGPRARDHRPHRHRRRHRARDRVRRRGGARAVDGSAHDDVQHGDRGRRARRHDRASTTARSTTSRAGRSRRPASCGTARSRTGARSRSDEGATFDTTLVFDASQVRPQVTWGTSPEMVVSIEDRVPDPEKERDATKREGIERALTYMGLAAQHADDRHQDRQGVHRLVHQLAHRGPAPGRRGRARPPRRQQHQARAGRAGLGPRQGAGRSRRASTASSATPASNGASRGARCASR